MNASMRDSLAHKDNFYIGEEAALFQLNAFNESIGKMKKSFIGYPCNASMRTEKFLAWWAESQLSKSPLNDVGDPYSKSRYSLNTHSFEKNVLSYFADLFFLKAHWGYITSGGTQGNEQGLYMGSQFLAKHGRPILYFSEEAHYSIASLGRVLGLESRVIKTKISGEMDYEDLSRQLDADRPALFSLSIGTTFKGAIDRIENVQEVVKRRGVKHVFYHADAALFGGYLPFYPDEAKPDLNFEKHPYDSIAVSGHKFFGSPIPLGIFLIREKYAHAFKGEYIEYIESQNISIPCSRSTLNTLVIWWIITTTPKEIFVREAVQIIKNAQYFAYRLEERDYPVWLNPYSNTVFFQAPPVALSNSWMLPSCHCPKLGHIVHAIMMQHVDKPMIDEFISQLDASGSTLI